MTTPEQPTPPHCPACTVQPYEPDLGPHHAHLTDYGYVLYGATPPQLDFVQSLLAEGRRLATEGWEREWGTRDPDGWVYTEDGNERRARILATADPRSALVSRLVGPWEPAEQDGDGRGQ